MKEIHEIKKFTYDDYLYYKKFFKIDLKKKPLFSAAVFVVYNGKV